MSSACSVACRVRRRNGSIYVMCPEADVRACNVVTNPHCLQRIARFVTGREQRIVIVNRFWIGIFEGAQLEMLHLAFKALRSLRGEHEEHFSMPQLLYKLMFDDEASKNPAVKELAKLIASYCRQRRSSLSCLEDALIDLLLPKFKLRRFKPLPGASLNPQSLPFSRESKLCEYEIPGYVVSIYESSAYLFYSVREKVRLAPLLKPYYKVIAGKTHVEDIARPEALFQVRVEIARAFLQLKLRNKRDLAEELSLVLALYSIGLGKIAPFLLDPKIEEFFSDGPNQPIYLDHSDYGRCFSNVALTSCDFERISSVLRVQGDYPLGDLFPTVKAFFRTNAFSARFLLDEAPLSDQPALCVRLQRRSVFSLKDLIDRGTLSSRIAALLFLALLSGCSLLVIGEPDSGKTTLVNALDMALPYSIRRIYIEDVAESYDLKAMGPYLGVKLKVEPVEKPYRSKLTKMFSSITTLHRSPDIVYFGEVLSREHMSTLLFCLRSGLQVIATSHSRSLLDFLRKWSAMIEVPVQDLLLFDYVVKMGKHVLGGRIRRTVEKVYELREGKERTYQLAFVGSSPEELVRTRALLSFSKKYGVRDRSLLVQLLNGVERSLKKSGDGPVVKSLNDLLSQDELVAPKKSCFGQQKWETP